MGVGVQGSRDMHHRANKGEKSEEILKGEGGEGQDF